MANFASGMLIIHDKIKSGKTLIASAHKGVRKDVWLLTIALYNGRVSRTCLSLLMPRLLPQLGRMVT